MHSQTNLMKTSLKKVNRKMYRAGMATILSQLARDERLFAIEALTAETPKTKVLLNK